MAPDSKPATSKVREAFKHEDPRIRRAAYVVIARLVPYDKELIPVVISALDDPDLGPDEKTPGINSVSAKAFDTLRLTCKLAGKDAAPKLIKIINSKKGTDGYQFFALLALANVSPQERLPLDMARQWLVTDDTETFLKATGVLCELGPHAKDVVGNLIAVANKKPAADPLKEQTIKMAIAGTFARIGPAAKEALPTLELMAETHDLTLRRRVLEAIKSVQGKE
jgi:hypothetical protein